MPSTNADDYASWSLRKERRVEALKQLQNLADEIGGTLERSEFDGPRELTLTFSYGPYRLMIEIDADCQIATFLGHWYIASNATETYQTAFENIVGDVNPYHRRKATTEQPTFTDFKAVIRAGFLFLAKPAEEQKAA